jgi:hypothetical protein
MTQHSTAPTQHSVNDEIGLCLDRALAVLDLLEYTICGIEIPGLAGNALTGACAAIRAELERVDTLATGAPVGGCDVLDGVTPSPSAIQIQ